MRPTDGAATLTCETLKSLAGLTSDREFVGLSPEIFAVPARQLKTLSLEDRSTFHIVYARYLYTRGEYRRALAKARCAVRLCRGGPDHALFARAKHVCGIACHHLGRVDEAAEQFLEAFVTYKRALMYEKMCLPLVSLGLLHLYTGDLAQARKVLSDALVYARKHSSIEKATDCAYDLLIAHMLSGNFAECRTALSEIRSRALLVLDGALCARYSGQLSVWHLETEESRELLKRAMVVFAREHFQRDYIICLEYLGMNEYFAGDYLKAREYYQQVLAMPEPTASAVAQTLRMLTDVYVAECDWKNAKETAIKAEQAITKINERIELAALWRAQAQIAEHDRDHDVARDLFQKSIDLLQQCGARYELALTHFAAGQSTVRSSTLRSEHLQQAKTLFTEMDVPRRVAQVEEVIVGLTPVKPQPKVFRNGKSSIETPDIITQNEQMLDILALAKIFMDTDCNILITGETGTGKDLLAKWIHCTSNRAFGPYCNENMARFTDSLIESELFGYEKGSHSRAERNKPGLIESANGGTFCLNEVAELSLDIQAYLLQLIEAGAVRRVGGREPLRVDVRFIAITNGDLQERVNAGLFRQDLYYRLRGVELHIPPLRERKDDLPMLIRHFLSMRHFGDYTLEEAVAIVRASGCECYNWPGNVRELQDVIRQAITRSPAQRVADLIGTLKMIVSGLSNISPEKSERAELTVALEQNGGNTSAAARTLGIPEATLRYRLKKQSR